VTLIEGIEWIQMDWLITAAALITLRLLVSQAVRCNIISMRWLIAMLSPVDKAVDALQR